MSDVQLGPKIDNKTGKNNNAFKTPRTIRVDTVLKNALNIKDSQKKSRLTPTSVDKAELKIGNPTLMTALRARSSRLPDPVSATNECIMWALKSMQNPTAIMMIIIDMVLKDSDMKYMDPTRPSMIESIVTMIRVTESKSGMKMRAMMNMT